MSMRAMRVAAIVGFASMVVSTYVSHLSLIARLPPSLYGTTATYLASLRIIRGVPVELFGALWFLFVLLVSSERTQGRYRSLGHLLFWSAAIMAGLGSALLYETGVHSIPIVIATAMAAWVWAIAMAQPETIVTAGGVRRVVASVAHDWKVVTSRSAAMSAWIGIAACAALVIQYMSFAAAATGQPDRDAELIRWYLERPRLGFEELTAPRKVRIVVFTDYECQFCSIQVPEFQRIAERYRSGGYEEIEVVVRDFPLNSDCNTAALTRVHPMACRAAAAARFIERTRSERDAQAFRTTLYMKRGKLTSEDVDQFLTSLGIRGQFENEHARDLKDVWNDARLGQRLGVTGTPAVFVDGRLVRNLMPGGLEVILDYHVGIGRGRRDVAHKLP